MFYKEELISFHILDVLSLRQENVSMENKGRNFNALSFRLRADATLTANKKEYHMKDNFVSYVPARLDYGRSATVDELIAVHFSTTNYSTRQIEYFEPKDPARLKALFCEILACWQKRELGYRYHCAALLSEILAECYRQNYAPDLQKSKIAPSVEYLLKNYKKSDLTVGEIAEKSFMSEVYFRKLFKAEYGTSPQKYIMNLRLQHAAGLITAGYYSLSEVALMSGYRDYKYFSVEFKKAMGVSPSEYLYDYKCE